MTISRQPSASRFNSVSVTFRGQGMAAVKLLSAFELFHQSLILVADYLNSFDTRKRLTWHFAVCMHRVPCMQSTQSMHNVLTMQCVWGVLCMPCM